MASCRNCSDETYGDETLCMYCFEQIREHKPVRRTHIHVLQDKVATLEARIAELEMQRQDIICYLALPKFDTETWVSKYDILQRLGRF